MLLTRPDGPEATDLHVSRRSFAALVAAGYAAFGAAVEAAPITTPSDGLTIASVTMPGGLPGYVARPAAAGRHPVVIVVNEVFGLHEYIRDVCRRLAKLGYVAVAPEFFYRADPGRTLATSTDFPAIIKIVETASNEQVMGDIDTTLKWLAAQPYASDRIGITGFCWGGGVVWMAAARFPQLKAGVAWYGRLAGPKPGQPVKEVRKYPLELADQMKCPVLGLYGGLDKGIAGRRRRCDARRAEGRAQAGRADRLSAGRARFPRRLPAELQRGGGQRWLGAAAGVVQGERRRLDRAPRPRLVRRAAGPSMPAPACPRRDNPSRRRPACRAPAA